MNLNICTVEEKNIKTLKLAVSNSGIFSSSSPLIQSLSVVYLEAINVL